MFREGKYNVVAGLGLEPRLSASEAPVLPLYDPAILQTRQAKRIISKTNLYAKSRNL